MVWIAGAAVTAAQLNLNAPQEWTTWTPSAIGGVTVGNGTLTGRYVRAGDTVLAWGRFTLGSTSSVSGVPVLNLPVTASREVISQGFFVDAGVTSYLAFAIMNATTNISIYPHTANGGLGWSPPFTFGSGDVVEYRTIFEAA